MRLLQTGTAFNGAYVDVGEGYSGNFMEPKYRTKFEAFLPLDSVGLNAFLISDIETDFGSRPDLVTFGVGFFFDANDINKVFGILFPTP